MKNAWSGRNLDAKLEMLSLIHSFKLYIYQDPRISRAYTAQKKKKNTLLACLAQRLSALTSSCGMDRARGVGAAPRRRRSNEAI